MPTPISHVASLCVFCGARMGNDPAYMEAAEALGQAMADENWRLVYGAGDVGIMGAVAKSAQAAGADTFGVIPVHLMAREVGKRDLTSFVVTENMHERKKVMYMNSDAIAVLPGGAGSLDEFFEVLTWRQLGLHDKPIILLNINGYWDPLIALMDNVISQGFADNDIRENTLVADSVDQLVAMLRERLVVRS
ncbi:TIGR00730 family Rossman fold protein [Aliiroseovarius sp. KMU-50]|uniref:Cytokinin riboside 5'-monophosphate phosphoribohydrolase n=1 Tax=Aliiroseovarius salicola TaxID=3009082 RepID=A0ABT4W1H2_9RHOB|nr:TIGR00730 family Rossman fold protein [Aliiroseovarius sp. KMU-50]MDA5094357.1 TIGR00730 family Rossman fold protein [Aliiroseovarius sp. KMU-50]